VPKLKTHKGTAKRLKITKSGKILYTKGGRSHLRRKKAKRVKRRFRASMETINASDRKRVRRLLPSVRGK